jgi:predicted nucleotide-binding protein
VTKASILLADNKKNFLKFWSGVLRRDGFEVTEAGSYSKAKELLDKTTFDMAVLDLRLKDDLDENDLSGLQLAEEYGGESLPIIIFTAKPTIKAARRALEKDGRSSPAVAFVEKEDGQEALLKAVRKAFVPRIFVVHGHDISARDAVEKFLSDVGLRKIILQTEVGTGQTTIEKFEEYSNVHFAIVIVTPDDEGHKREPPSDLRPRARQNVIFELGYFLGKLGRHRVVALYKKEDDEIEFPSNYESVGYLHMDSGGGWRVELAKSMRKAGIDVRV